MELRGSRNIVLLNFKDTTRTKFIFVGTGAAYAEGTAMNDNTVCCQNRDQTEPAGETLDGPL